MALIHRLLVLCLLLSAGFVANGEEKPATTLEPLALEANWWSYFESVTETESIELDKRINKLNIRLEELLKSMEAGQKADYSVAVKNIKNNLEQYAKLKFSTPQESPSIPPVSDAFTIEKAIQKYTEWRKMKRELDLEEGDLSWQRAQLALERKRQTQRRNEYLKMDASNPRRLALGISLIESRVNIELSALQAKWRQKKHKDFLQIETHLEEEINAIYSRLTASSATENNWLLLQAQEKASAQKIREKVTKFSGELNPDTPIGSANIKRILLKNAENEIRITTHELTAKRHQLSDALEQAIAVTGGKSHQIQSLRSVLKQYQDFEKSIEDENRVWQSLISQTRKFASEQTANLEASEPTLINAYKRVLKQVDENERQMKELSLEQDIGDFIVKISQEKLHDEAGWIERGIIFTETGIEVSWELIANWLNASLFEINEVPVTSLGLLRVVFIIFVALVISKLLRRGLEKISQRKEGVSASAIYTLGRVVHYLILVVGIIVGLSSIGIDFTKFALFASALGVGIGFGLQTLISNFVAGLIILFERSLKVGDFVELSSGLSGEVKEINMRSTLITTNDNVDILVPNSEFVNSQVTNWTLREAQRRIHVPFGVAYGTDKELVKKAVLEAAEEIKWTLKTAKTRQPQVWFVEFGDSSLNFELVVWLIPEAVKRPGLVNATYLWEIESKLNKYDIEIPFPQRDLHLRSVFGQKDEAGMEYIEKNYSQPVKL